MTNKVIVHHLEHQTLLVPVFHLMGQRLRIFDLQSAEYGRTQAILLQRDGDCLLLPIADDFMRSDGQHWTRQHTPDAITHALTTLEHDGWAPVSQITITFHGCDLPEGTNP